MVEDIETNMKILEDEFHELVTSTRDHMKKESVDVQKLRDYIMILPTTLKDEHRKFVRENKAEIMNENIDAIFITAMAYWNFLNYSHLQYVIEHLGSNEIKSKMKAFVKKICIFRRDTLLKPFSKVYSRKPNLKNEENKILETKQEGINLATVTLQYVEDFRNELSSELSLLVFSLQLVKIQDGCLMLTWQVSGSLVAHIQTTIKPNSPTMKRHNVSLFIVDGFVAYYSCAGN